MANKFCKEDLIQYKINGQTRPFIDQNLQLRVPHLEIDPSQKSFHNLYSYYSNYFKVFSDPVLPFNKQEIEKAMDQTRQSYQAWKRMQERIAEEVQKQLKD